MNNLFSTITIKGHQVKNRIVVPPMVCFGWSDESGITSKAHIEHYENLAKGGAGLIILEAHSVQKNGRLSSTQLGIWSDDHIEGLKLIADACHKHGATVLVQLHHAGFKTPNDVTATAVAPSSIDKNGQIARELTCQEIYEIQENFVKAAKRAELAGLDGIELHGAHGYLIDQFISPVINKREDKYGGTLTNRMTFVSEIIDKIKTVVSENFILGYRMGGNAPTLDKGIEVAKNLQSLGIDLLHVSAGISDGTTPESPKDFPYNWIVYLGTEIKKHVTIPVIAVNGIRTKAQAEFILESHMVDLIALGKAHLVEPNFANKIKIDIAPTSCLECKKCQWFTNGSKCPRLLNV